MALSFLLPKSIHVVEYGQAEKAQLLWQGMSFSGPFCQNEAYTEALFGGVGLGYVVQIINKTTKHKFSLFHTLFFYFPAPTPNGY